MKITFTILLASLLCAATAVQAQESPSHPPLNDQKRAAAQEKWRNATPEERAAWKAAHPEAAARRKAAAQEKWKNATPEERAAWKAAHPEAVGRGEIYKQKQSGTISQ